MIIKKQFAKILVFLSIGFLLSNCEDKKAKINELEGLWKLESMKIKDSATNNWENYRGGMNGYLLYDNAGHVALHLYDKDYPNYKPEFPNFTDTISSEALKHLTKSYYYIGSYSISEEESIVTHKKLSHSNPSEFFQTAQRQFYFSGDTLIMQPVESKNARLKLKWLKNTTY